jgi:NADPH2:quinone reductase
VNELAKTTRADRVLVLGASGGVGSMIVSLVHSCGAKVWAQTTKEANRGWIEDVGADEVVVCDAPDLAEKVSALLPTVVFDPLGDGFTGQAITALTEHGRLVLFGTSASQTGELPLQAVYRKSLTIFGYGGLIASEESLVNAKRRALQAVADGTMHVSVSKIFPLDEVNEALDAQARHAVPGKILLDLKV